MGQAICRCGQPLDVPPGAVTHLTCPTCSAKVRIVRKSASTNGEAQSGQRPGSSGDGFVRFLCPCGRKLRVSLLDRPTHGKCPECGKVVPVPADAASYVSPESPTAEMPAVDQARLEAWTKTHLGQNSATLAGAGGTSPPRRLEAGLRVCPQCGKPIHMGSETCRGCGTTVPKR